MLTQLRGGTASRAELTASFASFEQIEKPAEDKHEYSE